MDNLKAAIEQARRQFEMEVEATCAEITVISKDVAKAIGDVSITEAKFALAKEFSKRLLEGRSYAEFKGKK